MISLLFGAILPWFLLAAMCTLGYMLVRQNGRFLLRFELLEQQIAHLTRLTESVAMQGTRGAPSPQEGLPVGAPAPEFALPTLSGDRVSLSQYRGKRLLLTFFGPNCGYCVQMAPDLAALPLDDPLPLVVMGGSEDEIRKLVDEHQIKCPVLIQKGTEVSEKYKASGTPMGYLIDAEGKIASPLAAGAQALLTLAGEAVRAATEPVASETQSHGSKKLAGSRPLSESHILRTGLPPGSRAPDFKVPLVDGGELSFADYRGRRVVLVLSDPDCGPCNALAPKLEEAHRQNPDTEIILVNCGAIEENRRKAQEHGLTFPVAAQKHWEVSRAFGTFATPAGFLIDEHGIILSDVAQGPQPILELCARARNLQPEEGQHVMS